MPPPCVPRIHGKLVGVGLLGMQAGQVLRRLGFALDHSQRLPCLGCAAKIGLFAAQQLAQLVLIFFSRLPIAVSVTLKCAAAALRAPRSRPCLADHLA